MIRVTPRNVGVGALLIIALAAVPYCAQNRANQAIVDQADRNATSVGSGRKLSRRKMVSRNVGGSTVSATSARPPAVVIAPSTGHRIPHQTAGAR